jgi:folate-binding protein YgfZ
MSVSSYVAIAARGTDAFSFLQGQLSNDLRRLDREVQFLAAWCNPKGRVICLPRVGRESDGYRLALPEELAGDVTDRLLRFRFRAKVGFETVEAPPSLLDPDAGATFDLEAWRRRNLELGVPEIGAAQSEKYTPHMLNLDRLDALSLDKGCYTGQEVVARTHYRGATKRRMLRFVAKSAVVPGDELMSGGQKAGEVVNAIGPDLLAVVSLEFADVVLTIGGTPLVAAPLPYRLD